MTKEKQNPLCKICGKPMSYMEGIEYGCVALEHNELAEAVRVARMVVKEMVPSTAPKGTYALVVAADIIESLTARLNAAEVELRSVRDFQARETRRAEDNGQRASKLEVSLMELRKAINEWIADSEDDPTRSLTNAECRLVEIMRGDE